MNTYRIAIPSRRRAETLNKKTLRLLERCGVDARRVDVFVSDTEDFETYRQTLAATAYGNLIVAEPGMQQARNFIRRYYPEGQLLVCVDDDVSALKIRIDDRLLADFTDFEAVVQKGFEATERCGGRLWGIYPVANPLFMKPTITFDLRYIVGCFWGTVNSHDPRRFVDLSDKEDYLRTLQHYVLDGAVVRLNYVAPVTAYYTEPGGMQIERTRTRVLRSALELTKRYPELCKLNTSKKSGLPELRLRDRRRRAATE